VKQYNLFDISRIFVHISVILLLMLLFFCIKIVTDITWQLT